MDASPIWFYSAATVGLSALKLLGFTGCSWACVFSPLWFPTAVVAVVFGIIVAVCLYQR